MCGLLRLVVSMFSCVAKRIRKPHSRGDVLIFIIHLVYRRLILRLSEVVCKLWPIANCAVLGC